MTDTKLKPFLAPFHGYVAPRQPIWLMRQAGRYLPEYRAIRSQAGSFLDLCYSPALAAEVTLQPIRRFGFDAAILFSDILVVPHALGQSLSFVEGEGPRLEPIESDADLGRLEPAKALSRYASIHETVARVRQDLPRETALIGFCGAPWTVATYMVAGRGTPDQAPARLFAYRDPVGFRRLIDILVESSVDYLLGQVAAGAEAIQIFDTWAGSLPPLEFEAWVVQPISTLVARLRAAHPGLPIIVFARGAASQLAGLPERLGLGASLAGLSLDTAVDLAFARKILPRATVTQGNLDPLSVVVGGKALETAVATTLAATNGVPHVFNLGHGITPEAPIAHVERLVSLVRRGPQ
jgi:uroporphyrinogen decarboxylase